VHVCVCVSVCVCVYVCMYIYMCVCNILNKKLIPEKLSYFDINGLITYINQYLQENLSTQTQEWLKFSDSY